MVKELVPIVLSCTVWGKQLAGHWVLFECDNSSVVAAVNRQSTKAPESMHLLRCLWFFIAYFDLDVKCRHIPGAINCTADHFSRKNLHAFFCLHPQGLQQCIWLPQPLLQLLAIGGPDWTSAHFKQLFAIIIKMV